MALKFFADQCVPNLVMEALRDDTERKGPIQLAGR